VSTQRSFYDRPKEDCPFRKFHPAPRLARVVKPEAQSSVEPADVAHRDFAPSLATPCQALGEGIDLVVVTPGKREQFRREVLKPSGALRQTHRAPRKQVGLRNHTRALVRIRLVFGDVDRLLAQALPLPTPAEQNQRTETARRKVAAFPAMAGRRIRSDSKR
jgi:hypothetical protein